eukprot:CAMPEP_0173388176 /NCGR_PEP_ID=MMETSP1356-20130122/10556_1 /TAXON_ID=77927 ORGANISM="Hemiselmis virescens, Strain PCC157" /NCGR_SAMPLE_ID=MMETSP1356 /ASSEMBLY_ACC=CAM_ASM_000847 /LENGTH=61 /DNA_ID=CAMNT_0014345021 /DNA_START=27 /DNA_END=212 /DNA_ORIENTATION=+
MAFSRLWGSSTASQTNLLKMRADDVAPGGGDHKLMVRNKASALGNMCDMSEIKYAGCVAQF